MVIRVSCGLHKNAMNICRRKRYEKKQFFKSTYLYSFVYVGKVKWEKNVEKKYSQGAVTTPLDLSGGGAAYYRPYPDIFNIVNKSKKALEVSDTANITFDQPYEENLLYMPVFY